MYVEASMPELIEEIVRITERHFGKEHATPGVPGESLIKCDREIMEEHDYRSIVGKILYLTSKLMLEGCNASRESARFLSEAKEEHWKVFYRFVGYLKDNQNNIRLIYRKPRELRIAGNMDSDYATNKANRRVFQDVS